MSGELRTIIIVEDEPDTAQMFADMMELCGYRVLKTYGGQAAINLLSAHKPDALVLDLMMPDVSGLEVIRFVRSNINLMEIPIIVVSARSLPSDVKLGLDMGASIYLTKPVAFKDFKEAVDQAIHVSVQL